MIEQHIIKKTHLQIPIKNGITRQYLVGGFNPSEKIWKSVGIMIPNWMEK